MAEELPKQIKIKLLAFISLAEPTNTTKIYERFSRCQKDVVLEKVHFFTWFKSRYQHFRSKPEQDCLRSFRDLKDSIEILL